MARNKFGPKRWRRQTAEALAQGQVIRTVQKGLFTKITYAFVRMPDGTEWYVRPSLLTDDIKYTIQRATYLGNNLCSVVWKGFSKPTTVKSDSLPTVVKTEMLWRCFEESVSKGEPQPKLTDEDLAHIGENVSAELVAELQKKFLQHNEHAAD